MDSKSLNKLTFICLYAPKNILALKTNVNDIRIIWAEGRDRYKKKWAEWGEVVYQMALDALEINEGLQRAFHWFPATVC